MNTVNTITYHREGDYLLPDLVPPAPPRIGIWSIQRRDFLRKHHDGLYTGLLLSGKLNAHLEEIDRSANEMFDLLIKQYAEREGVTEELKAQDQMEWVRRMNGIRERVEETILYMGIQRLCTCWRLALILFTSATSSAMLMFPLPRSMHAQTWL